MTAFVPDDFEIPAGLDAAGFILRPLTIHHLVKDFDAVATSTAHLHGLFGPDDDWPEGVTLEQDLVDLGWHQKEFELRRSFTYTVMTPDESRCLGCVYIYPCTQKNHDAQVFLWARQSELADGLEETLAAAVKDWLATLWPFRRVAFPGRDISWPDWLALSSDQD